METSGVTPSQTVYKDYSKRLYSSIRLFTVRSVGERPGRQGGSEDLVLAGRSRPGPRHRGVRDAPPRGRHGPRPAGAGRLRGGPIRPPSVDLRRVRGGRRAGGTSPAGEVRTRPADRDLGAEQCRVGDLA